MFEAQKASAVRLILGNPNSRRIAFFAMILFYQYFCLKLALGMLNKILNESEKRSNKAVSWCQSLRSFYFFFKA